MRVQAGWVIWPAAAGWLASWYLMYLEITRWHHVRPSLAFNAQQIPGTDLRAKPGLPLILVYAACVLAPPLTVAGVVARLRRPR